MTTSWERLCRAVISQAPAVARGYNADEKELVRTMLAGARCEGGWGEDPGVGDGGLAWGWYQFHIGGGIGRDLIDQQGWRDPRQDPSDFFNEDRVVAFWMPRIAAEWQRLGSTQPDRWRTALFNCEKPAGWPHKLAREVYIDARWQPGLHDADAAIQRIGLPVEPPPHHDPTFQPPAPSAGEPASGECPATMRHTRARRHATKERGRRAVRAAGGKGGASLATSGIALGLITLFEGALKVEFAADFEAELAVIVAGVLAWVIGVVPSINGRLED